MTIITLRNYLKALTDLIGGTSCNQYKKLMWCIKKAKEYVTVTEFKGREGRVEALIGRIIERIRKLEASCHRRPAGRTEERPCPARAETGAEERTGGIV